MILFLSGDMDKDRFKRSHTGLTLKQRAVDDFQRGLTRALQRVGVLAEPRPTTARSELGCDPAPRPRFAASSVYHLRRARSQAEKQSGRHHDARCRQGRRRAARLDLHHVRGYGGLRPVALRGRQYVCLQRPALGVRLSSEPLLPLIRALTFCVVEDRHSLIMVCEDWDRCAVMCGDVRWTALWTRPGTLQFSGSLLQLSS